MALIELDYQAFYCEENIWRLACRTDVIVHAADVVFISNARGRVACWHQRAAPPNEPIGWDYHVVLAEQTPEGSRIWDLDSRIGLPCDARSWVGLTFQDPELVYPIYHPRFRVAPREVFVETFASDRSHMRIGDRYRKPPPPWAPPGTGSNLASWIDMDPARGPGEVLDREAFERRYCQD